MGACAIAPGLLAGVGSTLAGAVFLVRLGLCRNLAEMRMGQRPLESSVNRHLWAPGSSPSSNPVRQTKQGQSLPGLCRPLPAGKPPSCWDEEQAAQHGDPTLHWPADHGTAGCPRQVLHYKTGLHPFSSSPVFPFLLIHSRSPPLAPL